MFAIAVNLITGANPKLRATNIAFFFILMVENGIVRADVRKLRAGDRTEPGA